MQIRNKRIMGAYSTYVELFDCNHTTDQRTLQINSNFQTHTLLTTDIHTYFKSYTRIAFIRFFPFLLFFSHFSYFRTLASHLCTRNSGIIKKYYRKCSFNFIFIYLYFLNFLLENFLKYLILRETSI